MEIKVKAVLERMTDGQFAVILVEEMNKQFNVPLHKLPSDAKAGDWFDLTLEAETIVDIEKNDAYADEQARAIASVMEKLRNKTNKK